MMRLSLLLLTLTAALLLAGCACTPCSTTTGPLNGLPLLEGRWVSEDGQTTETWNVIDQDRLTGRGETPARNFHEDLEITIDEQGRTVYLASPMGRQPPTPFVLMHVNTRVHDGSRTDSWTFENPDNDFPQRIVYDLAGDHLTATISSLDEERRVSWTFRRAE